MNTTGTASVVTALMSAGRHKCRHWKLTVQTMNAGLRCFENEALSASFDESAFPGRYAWIDTLEDARLLRAIMKLNKKDLELLTYVTLEGHGQEELARRWGCTQAAVAIRMKKIKNFSNDLIKSRSRGLCIEGTFSVRLVQLEKYISSDLNDIKRMSLKRNSDAEDARRPPVRERCSSIKTAQ